MSYNMKESDPIIRRSNRVSGSWLPNVNLCPNRAVPCGNARALDEAIRAGEIMAGKPGAIGKIQAKNALSNAHKICSHCPLAGNGCPAENALNVSISSVIKQVFDYHADN